MSPTPRTLPRATEFSAGPGSSQRGPSRPVLRAARQDGRTPGALLDRRGQAGVKGDEARLEARLANRSTARPARLRLDGPVGWFRDPPPLLDPLSRVGRATGLARSRSAPRGLLRPSPSRRTQPANPGGEVRAQSTSRGEPIPPFARESLASGAPQQGSWNIAEPSHSNESGRRPPTGDAGRSHGLAREPARLRSSSRRSTPPGGRSPRRTRRRRRSPGCCRSRGCAGSSGTSTRTGPLAARWSSGP
jgi:hypothetical protein